MINANGLEDYHAKTKKNLTHLHSFHISNISIFLCLPGDKMKLIYTFIVFITRLQKSRKQFFFLRSLDNYICEREN